MKKRNLPIGIQDFRTLREFDAVYVDKTELIYKLITEGKSYFLSRPRRFGKSLLVSTMKEIFQGSRTLFADLSYTLHETDEPQSERFYHSIIHLMFKYLGVYVDSEVHSSRGRADCIVQTQTHVYIFEFKYNKTGKAAFDQILKKGYADKYRASGKTITGIGVNFSGRKKAITGWLVKELN